MLINVSVSSVEEKASRPMTLPDVNNLLTFMIRNRSTPTHRKTNHLRVVK